MSSSLRPCNVHVTVPQWEILALRVINPGSHWHARFKSKLWPTPHKGECKARILNLGNFAICMHNFLPDSHFEAKLG